MDRSAYYLTALHIVALSVIGVGLYLLYDGGLVSAWFASAVVAMLLLMSLSIPRYLELGDSALVVGCLLDLTEIDYDQIATVRKVTRRELRGAFPIFGSYGFFGYFGHYFDILKFRRVVIYASDLRYLVEIVDVYEDSYYVSCNKRDELIAEIKARQVIDAVEN